MDSISNVTEESLLQAIRQAIQDAEEAGAEYRHEGITRPEAIDLFGISAREANAVLSRMVDAGILQRSYISRPDAWGKVVRRPGYKLVGSNGHV